MHLFSECSPSPMAQTSNRVSSLQNPSQNHFRGKINLHPRSSSVPSRLPQTKLKDAQFRTNSPEVTSSISKVQSLEQQHRKYLVHSTDEEYSAFSLMQTNSNDSVASLSLLEPKCAPEALSSVTADTPYKSIPSGRDQSNTKPMLSIPPPTYSRIRIRSSKSPINAPFHIYAKSVAPTTNLDEGKGENDIQKALKTVNSYIPQVNLYFLKSNGQKDNAKDVKKEPCKPKWLEKKKDTISKVSGTHYFCCLCALKCLNLLLRIQLIHDNSNDLILGKFGINNLFMWSC